MFNLKQHNSPQTDLLLEEMRVLGISPIEGGFKITVGDDLFDCFSPSECCQHIENGIEELRKEIWETWNDLGNVAEVILHNTSENSGSLNNLLFLNSVKKSFLLSRVFSDLREITNQLRSLFNIDIAEVHENLIHRFNSLYLRIRLIHYLIMSELYRLNVMHKWSRTTKQAQVSGPWANLDLPMQERLWEWDEDEEYFENREKARREQVRYNPETNMQGFFYVWQDLSRDPYLFTDMKKDSPYKSRMYLSIP